MNRCPLLVELFATVLDVFEEGVIDLWDYYAVCFEDAEL